MGKRNDGDCGGGGLTKCGGDCDGSGSVGGMVVIWGGTISDGGDCVNGCR